MLNKVSFGSAYIVYDKASPRKGSDPKPSQLGQKVLTALDGLCIPVILEQGKDINKFLFLGGVEAKIYNNLLSADSVKSSVRESFAEKALKAGNVLNLTS